MANCSLNEAGLIVCFKTSDNTFVIWVNIHSQVWLKNFNSNVLKTFRDNMAQKVILKEKNLSFLCLKFTVPLKNLFLVEVGSHPCFCVISIIKP